MAPKEQPVCYTDGHGTPIRHEPTRDTSMGELLDLAARHGTVKVKHILFAGEPLPATRTAAARARAIKRQREKLQAELAAMDAASAQPPTGEFAEPPEPIPYPRCRWCGDALTFGVCPRAGCAGKDVAARYDRIDGEMERSK